MEKVFFCQVGMGWFATKLCHSTLEDLENCSMNTFLKNKNAWGQPSSYCQTILFKPGISPSGARDCQSSAFCCEKGNTEREKSPEVLSIWPWSAALKWSQWHLASPTKNKRFFFFLVWRKGYRKKRKWFQLSRDQCASSLVGFPVWALADWLACMTDSAGGRQKNTFRGLNKVALSIASQTKGPN